MSHATTPLRWAGSKRKLLPLLEQFWRPTDGTYIEAFAGSACLFFHLSPPRAVLNDCNAELISAYEVLRTHPLLLHEVLQDMPCNEQFYYEVRRRTEGLDKFESAVRFFFLNRYCFNGIYRTNKAGAFNVPFAGRKTGGFPRRSRWLDAARVLRAATLVSDDFESIVLNNVSAGDFVYLDPPYAVSNRRVFVQYNASEFGNDDLRRLSSVMRQVDQAGAVFVVSYAHSPETKELSRGWYTCQTTAQRNVAGFSKHRRRATEVLITNDPDRVPSEYQDARVRSN